jgi:hypothetical protein
MARRPAVGIRRPGAAVVSHWTHAEFSTYLKRTGARKYRNRETVDGFDSEKERRVWQDLELRAKAGEITHLRRQVAYPLIVNGQLVASYVADYVWVEGAMTVVADAKSEYTRKLPVYRLKRKLMQACHGIDIQEV